MFDEERSGFESQKTSFTSHHRAPSWPEEQVSVPIRRGISDLISIDSQIQDEAWGRKKFQVRCWLWIQHGPLFIEAIWTSKNMVLDENGTAVSTDKKR
jgi:hypothetical protein